MCLYSANRGSGFQKELKTVEDFCLFLVSPQWNVFTHATPILTDGVKAVDVEACWASVSYVDLLQAVVGAVGQYDLHSHHTGLVQTGLPREMVLGRQTLPCHMVKQFIGFHGAEWWSGDLEGRSERSFYTQTMLKKKSNLLIMREIRHSMDWTGQQALLETSQRRGMRTNILP